MTDSRWGKKLDERWDKASDSEKLTMLRDFMFRLWDAHTALDQVAGQKLIDLRADVEGLKKPLGNNN